MEGRWGRRVYGWIREHDGQTWFHLEMEMGEKFLSVVQAVPTRNLVEEPWIYGFYLDFMTFLLDEQVQGYYSHNKNTP